MSEKHELSWLWAPWRETYVTKSKKVKCIFCAAVKAKTKDPHFVTQTKHSFILLNIYPYNAGHVMVSPKRHVSDISKLRQRERIDLMDLINSAQQLLKKIVKPHGFNIGMNIGVDAGAGFPKHLHVHIVPRWKSDTNFMPVISKTRVLSQSLQSLCKEMRHECQKRN